MKLGKKYGFDHFSFYVANMILGLHYTNISVTETQNGISEIMIVERKRG